MAPRRAAAATPASSAAPGAAGGSLAAALSTADAEAAQRLATLGLVYQARQSQLARTAASVTAQQGAGSAAAIAAQAAAAAAQAAGARIAVVRQQVTTAAPAAPAAGWVLHGHVYSAQLAPAAGYCAFLVDAQNAYYPATGFAYTDSTGYFLLTYPGPAAKVGADTGTDADEQAAPPPELAVEITNPAGQPVYLGTAAPAPATGTAAYQALSLPPGEPPIGDPPAALRATALPPQPDR
jgi:hypothetical protein